MRMRTWMVLVVLAAVAGLPALAEEDAKPVQLEPGDKAPAFELPGSDGKTHRLEDYKGRAVVIAWFPKAFTGG